MKTKTSDLTGPALDWAVAKALGLAYRFDDKYGPMCYRPQTTKGEVAWDSKPLPYSTDWSQGGPIIEQERIETRYYGRGSWCGWAEITGGIHGPTPLIAAMRCFVSSKLGDEVDVPEELT